MRSQNPGKVCDGLWYLGTLESGLYVLEGSDQSIMISGGLAYIVPTVMRQMEEFGLDEDRIKTILILHSHFDHIGTIPYFRRRHPGIRVLGSERAWKILGKQQSIDTINAFNRMATERMGMAEECSGYDLDWPQGASGENVSEGQIIGLGNPDLQIFETPGHSSCSISAYAPKIKALFASDAGGIPLKDTIIISANSNFTKYQHSLDKLAPLDVEYVCADHFGYVYGEEAKVFIARAIEMAASERSRMEEVYGRTRDLGAAAKEISGDFFAKNPDYFMDPEIYLGVCRQMMRHIAKCMEE